RGGGRRGASPGPVRTAGDPAARVSAHTLVAAGRGRTRPAVANSAPAGPAAAADAAKTCACRWGRSASSAVPHAPVTHEERAPARVGGAAEARARRPLGHWRRAGGQPYARAGAGRRRDGI